jgi:hypothetical protein
MHTSHNSARVDEDSRRLSFNSICATDASPFVQCDRERYGEEVDEALNVLDVSFLIPAIHCEDVQAWLRMLQMKFDELGKFCAAWRAPRSLLAPAVLKVWHDHLSKLEGRSPVVFDRF